MTRVVYVRVGNKHGRTGQGRAVKVAFNGDWRDLEGVMQLCVTGGSDCVVETQTDMQPASRPAGRQPVMTKTPLASATQFRILRLL